MTKELIRCIRRGTGLMMSEGRDVLRKAPLSTKAQAIKRDKRTRKNQKEESRLRGKQISPAGFTRFIEPAYDLRNFTAQRMEKFMVKDYM